MTESQTNLATDAKSMNAFCTSTQAEMHAFIDKVWADRGGEQPDMQDVLIAMDKHFNH